MSPTSITSSSLSVTSLPRSTSTSGRWACAPSRSRGGGRWALAFGSEKLNLHELGNEYLPNARHAQPGSADLCLLTETPIDAVIAHLEIPGRPDRARTDRANGATGELCSVYVRDPDGNLVEVANRVG